MLTATFLAPFLIPMFFVLVRKIRKHDMTPEERAAADAKRHEEIDAHRHHDEGGEQPA